MNQSNKNTERTICKNRKYKIEYEVIYTVDCGMVLQGDEVKSIRNSSISITESYGLVKNNEIFIKNLTLLKAFTPDRMKKLLLHRRQINKIIAFCLNPSIVVIPTEVYEKNGIFKVIIICGKKLKKFDKREKIKQKEMNKNKQQFF